MLWADSPEEVEAIRNLSDDDLARLAAGVGGGSDAVDVGDNGDGGEAPAAPVAPHAGDLATGADDIDPDDPVQREILTATLTRMLGLSPAAVERALAVARRETGAAAEAHGPTPAGRHTPEDGTHVHVHLHGAGAEPVRHRRRGDPLRFMEDEYHHEHGAAGKSPSSPSRYARGAPEADDPDAASLAHFYAQFLTALCESGIDPGDVDDETERANDELAGTGWRVEDGGDGDWQAVHDEADTAEAYARRGEPLRYAQIRVPKGVKFTFDGKEYRGGMWMKRGEYEAASPEVKEAIARGQEEGERRKAERQKARRAAGPARRADLAERLKNHADASLTSADRRSAGAAWRMLRRHHGEDVLHRVRELADLAERGLRAGEERVAEDPEATGLRDYWRKELGRLHHMLGLAGVAGIETSPFEIAPLPADRDNESEPPPSETSRGTAEAEPGPEPAPSTESDGSGSGADGAGTEGDRGDLAEAPGRPAHSDGDSGGTDDGEPARAATPARVPARIEAVNRRLDRYEQHFRSRGNHKVADWMGLLRNHINEVGVEAALDAIGPEVRGKGEEVQYGGHNLEGNGDADFIAAYLGRAGIGLVQDAAPEGERPAISTVAPSSDEEGLHSRGDARDFFPTLQTLRNKLHEAQHLPGLEKSEDLGKAMGQEFGTIVPEFTPDVVKKLDDTYGEGKWIVKSYGDEAYAGYGIFFPQRVAQVQQDARDNLWDSGQQLARYGFEHVREDPSRDGFAAVLAGQAPTVDDGPFRVGRNIGGQEQDVYYDEKNDRFNKIAKTPSGQNATQKDFLERHAALNAIWPELGYRMEGLTPDGRPVVSMNAIGGTTPTAREVDDWLWDNDWEPVGEGAGLKRGEYDPEEGPDAWRNRRTGVVIGDTHGGNWKRQADGELLPIDIDLQPGDPAKLPKRQPHARVVGVRHQDGSTFRFGSDKYQQLYGDVRNAADLAMQAAGNEAATAIPKGRFMAQPAFPVVGITNEERAQGVTFKRGQEGRVHVVTRNGKAELVPHSTWLKQEPLPVVFENEDTRAMAQAALDAINALPESERRGQLYAPDIVKTADGYRVVEANPANEAGASGYLQDNPLIIDSYVSQLTGREPAHVRFIRNLLSNRKGARAPSPGTSGRPPAPTHADRLRSAADAAERRGDPHSAAIFRRQAEEEGRRVTGG